MIHLAMAALAEPPHGEAHAGYTGTVAEGYGWVTAAPSVARVSDASLVVQGTVSELFYSWNEDGLDRRVDSPGAAIGPGFVYAPRHLTLNMGVAFEVRRPTLSIDGTTTETTTELGASLTAGLHWRPVHRAAVYGNATLSGATEYLWARGGAMFPVIPTFRRDAPVALWLGAEVTHAGSQDTQSLAAGGVAEVPVRALGAAFSARLGASIDHDRNLLPSAGAGVYWAW